MKILLLKPSSLGDVVQAMPVLRLLKLHWPDAEIFWWIDSRLAPLLEGDRDLAGVILFERRGWGKLARWKNLVREILALRRHNFDLVIDLQGLARSGVFAWLANGKLLIGLDEPREGATGFYDRIARRASFHTHAVDWYLSVLPPLGVAVHKNFDWLPERPAAAANVREKFSPQGQRWLAVQPGARWMNKRWPVENYAALVAQLAAQFPDLHFAILGGADERALGDTIAAAMPSRALNLCGQITLPEMIEWLRLCTAMVTNDTGPMHVAAALGKPVVGIFGPTEPSRTGPYGQLENILRVPLPCA
ncbi:MAG: lipopolysaccharide heptosyltransferase, partial [Verrucomicrobiota bacterium]